MTDLEITRLCAKAMGMEVTYVNWPEPETDRSKKVVHAKFPEQKPVHYDPLHNKEQAIDLLYWLSFECEVVMSSGEFHCNSDEHALEKVYAIASEFDLLGAVCECAAKVQAAK